MTSHTAVLYFETLLGNEWTKSVTDRVNDVPQPYITIAGDEDDARLTQQHEDLLFVTKGGSDSRTPQSVGWSEKRAENMVTIDLRTSHSRARLEGTRDNSNEAERYGGLAGETERILDKVRKGDKEYDWIDGYEYRDLSEEMGYGFWRGTWEVRLTELAHTIDSQP